MSLRDKGPALDPTRRAKLQLGHRWHVQNDPADRRLLVVLIGVVLAFAHLIVEPDLIVEISGGEAASRGGTDVPDVTQASATCALGDEHRALDRLDLGG